MNDKTMTVKTISRKMRIESQTVIFNIIGFSLIGVLSIICLLPFLLMVSGSFTAEGAIGRFGFSLIPKAFSLDAYDYIIKSKVPFIRAYGITISVTVLGTLTGLFLSSMIAYVLCRKDFVYRNKIAFFIYFTTLFSGGLIPWYILVVNYLHLKDNYMVMIIPMLMSPWNILLMRNFMKSIPDSIIESAKLDGANDMLIYIKLILPLSTAAIATIGLFMALAYWNDWFTANLFITNDKMYPLQFFLYKLLANTQFLRSGAGGSVAQYLGPPPSESLKMATAVVVTGPIILLYPFIQRFFVKGLILGAVKG